MIDPTRLYSGEGIVSLGKLDEEGMPMGFEDLGNCSSLVLNPSVNRIEHMERRSGRRKIDRIIEKDEKIEMSMNLDSFAASNLITYVYGTLTKDAAITVTDEEVKAYKGRHLKLPRINLMSWVSLKKANDTVSEVGTDYTVDLENGVIFIPSSSTITNGEVVKASYTANAAKRINAFARANKNVALLFTGLNTAENDNPVRIELFKVRLDPVADIPLINDEYAEYSINGTVLYDQRRPAETGGYMTIELVEP